MFSKHHLFIAGLALPALLTALALTVASPGTARADSIYFCQQNDFGRVRLVGSADSCRGSETAVEIETGTDLGDIEAQIDALAERIGKLEESPRLLAVPLSSVIPVGERILGCDLLERSAPGVSPRLFIAECNNSGPGIITTRSSHGAVVQIAPDPDYVYDGLFLCMTVGDLAIARDDSIDSIRTSVTPLSLEGDPDSDTVVHIRSTGSTPTVRTLTLPSFDEAEVPEPEFTEPQLPCKTLLFADGTNFLNPHFEFDTWGPPGALQVKILFPTLDGRDHTDPNDGDQVRIYQLGLTVAGRRGEFE